MKRFYIFMAMMAVAFCMSAQVPKLVDPASVAGVAPASRSHNFFSAMEQQRQSAYKGSIFTKTPIFIEDFHDTTTYSVGWNFGAGYQSAAYSHWNWMPNNAAYSLTRYQNLFPGLFHPVTGLLDYQYDTFTSPTCTNGYVLMSMWDATPSPNTMTYGTFDSWLALKGVSAPSSSSMYDVTFYQWYRCFNFDSCFVEYSSDSTNWNRIRINRKGVDMLTNQLTSGYKTVSLPLAVRSYQNLYVRFHWYSDTSAGGAYGYFWMIDDVSIEQASNNRIQVLNTSFADGGYHLVPQGVGGNKLLWMARTLNNSSFAQTTVKGKVKNSFNTVIAQSQTVSTMQPNALLDTMLFIDPYGRYTNYYEGNTSATYGTSSPLPSLTQGTDSISVSISSDSLDFGLDTILYNVNVDPNGDRVWGRDNGILTGYSHWKWGVTYNGDVTPVDADLGESGYSLRVMYATPDTVPTGWVIRGVEIVPSTRVGYTLPGAQLSATLTRDSAAGNSVYFINIPTGAGNYTLSTSDINDFITGYRPYGTYNTIRILFPGQPELKPSTKYWIGYTMNQSGTFTPATDRSFYYGNDSVARALPGRMGHRFGPGAAPNVMVIQPSFFPSSLVAMGGYSSDETPMIRMIVGPYRNGRQYNVTWDVTPAGSGFVTNAANPSVDITGQTILYPGGTTVRFYIEPYPGNTILSIEKDGIPISLTNDPNLILHQGYYEYVLPLQAKDMEDEVHFGVVTNGSGSLDPADNAVVKLQPNPATTSASLTIEGVYGQVECSLIDINGRTIQSKTIDANATHRLNLEGLARGTYFVRITNDRFTKVEKLIVR